MQWLGLAAKEAREESVSLAGLLRGFWVAGAAFTARHMGHDLLDMLAAPGPGGFPAFAAFGRSAHVLVPRDWGC